MKHLVESVFKINNKLCNCNIMVNVDENLTTKNDLGNKGGTDMVSMVEEVLIKRKRKKLLKQAT